MIKLCYDVNDYRRQISEVLSDGDTVIELGCHTGNTSKVILENDVSLIAIDNSPEAKKEMDKLDLIFINADVRLHDTLSEVFNLIQGCDVLAIDLGGGYHPDTVFKVFYIWSSTFKPKHTVIRNRGLVEFYNSVSEVSGDYKSLDGFLDSYKDSGIPPQIKEFDLWTPMPKK
ncbi:MAG: SAM-dependent methyltransferase [Methanobrevibacter sp.]|uniref:SAM-dependent methyltransferase n=1 Tax=Methanobrevibacter millerae TaxID=230361 RepID=A0A8T3VHE8_9EURY|nr:SAM-dependent methyltransferase [Methanobrevibacter millerae]MBE6504191.1 SAM-dependent methyltransferase [Methanobrevibacter millerae]MBQ6345419.1 SAM-dependent methyltransferase [Methanobrevibacter sp.]MBR0372194.1 SAM-dependent methyltransferase [Methanobrevibacter sp.]